MLHRPPSDNNKAERQRARWSRAKRAQRRRRRDGTTTCMVEVSGDVIGWLILTEWLDRAHDHNKLAVADAIERMLEDSAR